MCCTRLAGNTGRNNDAKNRHLGTIAHLCRAISSQLRHISTIEKKLLSSNIFPTYPYNMVNFSPLADEIFSLVWGTTASFNGFRVLAALLHSHTAALNRGRHLYSVGRPSRWVLAHISSFCFTVRCLALPLCGCSDVYCRPSWQLLSSCFVSGGHSCPFSVSLHRPTVTSFLHDISMPAAFFRHEAGQAVRSVCYCDITFLIR